MNDRKGTTLVEVLVAIFIMAIGALAILAMFPLSVASMARAIQDDRTAHSAANARAIGEALNIRFDNIVTPYFNLNSINGNVFAVPLKDSQSFPVYVDPVGYYTYSATTRSFVATTNIPRCSLSCIDNVPALVQAKGPGPTLLYQTQSALRWCSLLDDITFAPNGMPDLSSGTVDREISYSWAWMIRRPRYGVAGNVDVSVVVYSQRSFNTSFPAGAKETAYQSTLVPDTGNPTPNQYLLNKVTLTWTAGLSPQPRVEEGSWLLDATPGPQVKVGANMLYQPGNSAFYRVVNVSDPYTVGALSAMDVELALPLAGFSTSNSAGPVMVVMDGVVEVMTLSSGWQQWSSTSQ
jgi:prepilin-type N-terminal cleavage/methylation domain-containing protein